MIKIDLIDLDNYTAPPKSLVESGDIILTYDHIYRYVSYDDMKHNDYYHMMCEDFYFNKISDNQEGIILRYNSKVMSPGFMQFSHYDDNLKCKDRIDLNILQVYRDKCKQPFNITDFYQTELRKRIKKSELIFNSESYK